MSLDVQNVHFRYTEKPVVEGVSLSIYPGEILALLGPNGSGKTTLLKLLSGVLTPTAGQVCLEGRPLRDWNRLELARQLAAVEQHIQLPFEFTVRDIVAMGRHPHIGRFQRSSQQDHDRIQQALERTETVGFAKRPLSSLSSGESQRVWLAMALAQEPKILLLDEPTSHLDIHHQLHFLQTLRSLAAEGLSVVMSIHDLNLAGLFAHRVALLHQGALHSVGDPTEVLTASSLREVFQAEVEIVRDESGRFRGAFPRIDDLLR